MYFPEQCDSAPRKKEQYGNSHSLPRLRLTHTIWNNIEIGTSLLIVLIVLNCPYIICV